MQMKRRDFIKRSAPAAAILPGLINGFAVRAFSAANPKFLPFLPPVDTDHVLVIVQLTGGNDGLNTVIPISNYSDYYNARTNVAIPEAKILKLDNYLESGLHPSMTGMRSLYQEGKVAIMQAVGYPLPNFSHFRATDIWMSASDSNTVVNTGWGGRYLSVQYPNYPNGYPTSAMPDPLAIQIGSVTSLTCQGPVVNMGMSITDPNSFYNLINGVQDPVPNTPMGYELSFIRDVAQQTNAYAQRVKAAAGAVTQQAAYPSNNSLADQLKIVARLIKGGLKTRMYMVNYGGFDTHSLQVQSGDTTVGTHANLLANVSNAIKAFMDDVYFLGVQDRVMGMTFSEFGRRIKSNASGGTDHGAAAPMFLFGKHVVPGVYGTNPAIPATTTFNDNIPFQYDFRSVYATVLKNWFCVPDTDQQMIMLKQYPVLNMISSKTCKPSVPQPGGDNLVLNYPNPFVDRTTISFTTAGGHTVIQIINTQGQLVNTLIDQDYPAPGTYTVEFNSMSLASGVYYARLQNGVTQQVRTMLKVR
jgi:uncharacterized protein (DUF1501 family)